VHTQSDCAFHFRMLERTVKAVNFDVCQKRPQSNSNVPWATAKLMSVFLILIHVSVVSTNAEMLITNSPVGLLALIFGVITRFLPSHPKRFNFYPPGILDLSLSILQFCRKLVVITTSLEESEKDVQNDKVHANIFQLVKKIVKIGPAYPEIIGRRSK